ncbi:MAG: terpene cyclase/mutase family protein, partial [Thermoguttaceae bacterium]|nr:terpene cyclase/mutase family protein [Thermoguttaceae bacterium]
MLGRGSKPSEEAPQTIESFKDSMAKEEQELILSDEAGVVTAKQRASSWGLSVFVHAVIILILTFVFFPLKPQPREVEAVFSTEIGDQLDFLTDDSGNLNPNDADNYAFTVPEELKVEDAVVFEKRELPFESDVAAPIFDQSRIEMSDMLSGRTDPGLKNDLLSKYGGNKTTEESVEAALRWLRRQQEKDGSWSLNGPYKDGIHSLDNRPAATALALLAFQGAGNTRTSGEHSIAVRRGWTWLLKQQNPDGSFAPSNRSSEALFYTQAICTIALCEMITLEKSVSSSVRKQAKAAVDYLLENQHAKLGGWKYAPQESSDLSVTGWCVMALKTAEMANISVPESNYKRVSAYLDSISYDDGA